MRTIYTDGSITPCGKKGGNSEEIEQWFRQYRGGRSNTGGIRWKSAAKEGSQELTGTNIANTDGEYYDIWEGYCEVKQIRDQEVVHVSYGHETAGLSNVDAVKYFRSIMKAILLISKLCDEVRSEVCTTLSR